MLEERTKASLTRIPVVIRRVGGGDSDEPQVYKLVSLSLISCSSFGLGLKREYLGAPFVCCIRHL